MAMPPLSRRERNKLETRARLLASATALFGERGYDETSIDEIADRADVARGTAINYFRRKEDYLGAIATDRQAIFKQALAEGVAKGLPTADLILRALDAHAAFYERDEEPNRRIVREWLRAGGPLLAEASN